MTRSGFAVQPVERPAEPRLARLAGVARDAAIDDARGNAVAAQRRLQLRSEAQALLQAIAGRQAVAERQHAAAAQRRAGAGRG